MGVPDVVTIPAGSRTEGDAHRETKTTASSATEQNFPEGDVEQHRKESKGGEGSSCTSADRKGRIPKATFPITTMVVRVSLLLSDQ